MTDRKTQRDLTRRPTRNDVAELAGVSTAVVSYVMNDGPRNVAPATRQKVLDAVEELGYRPNDVARSLRSQRNGVVGLVGDASISAGLNAMSAGVAEVLAGQSYLLTVAYTGVDQERDAQTLGLLTKRVDGVLFVPSGPAEAVPEVVAHEKVPVVAVGTRADELPAVFVDPGASGSLAMEYLLSLGHVRVGVLGRAASDADSGGFLQGCERALAAAGIAGDDDLVLEIEVGIDAGVAAAGQLLDLENPPTALITQNDLTALGVLDELQQRGLAVPGDVSVVGVDDLELGHHMVPTLTTVPVRSHVVGQVAARVLMDLVDGETVPLQSSIDPEVVVRESTGPVR